MPYKQQHEAQRHSQFPELTGRTPALAGNFPTHPPLKKEERDRAVREVHMKKELNSYCVIEVTFIDIIYMKCNFCQVVNMRNIYSQKEINMLKRTDCVWKLYTNSSGASQC